MKKALVLFAVAMFATGIVTAAEVKKDAAKDAKTTEVKADAKAASCPADAAKKGCCKTDAKDAKADTKEVKK